jgi:hypothetical protein
MLLLPRSYGQSLRPFSHQCWRSCCAGGQVWTPRRAAQSILVPATAMPALEVRALRQNLNYYRLASGGCSLDFDMNGRTSLDGRWHWTQGSIVKQACISETSQRTASTVGASMITGGNGPRRGTTSVSRIVPPANENTNKAIVWAMPAQNAARQSVHTDPLVRNTILFR